MSARGNRNIQKYQTKCEDKGETAARQARLSLAAAVHILREMSVLLGVVDGRVTRARLGRAAPGSQLEGSNSAVKVGSCYDMAFIINVSLVRAISPRACYRQRCVLQRRNHVPGAATNPHDRCQAL